VVPFPVIVEAMDDLLVMFFDSFNQIVVTFVYGSKILDSNFGTVIFWKSWKMLEIRNSLCCGK